MRFREIDNSIMNFKNWVEQEASLGGRFPEIGPLPVNRGSDTPASDGVKRTGLQPQVDAQELNTKSHKEQDNVLAIDSGMEHMDTALPDGDDTDTPKINRFKKLWDELKEKWEERPHGPGIFGQS